MRAIAGLSDAASSVPAQAEGKYVARGLSFRAAEFESAAAPLTSAQAAPYDAAAATWQRVRAELVAAAALTGAGTDVWRVFWAAQQRFFKLLCVSLKVPAVLRAARAALAAGECVVIGLQSTGEAAADALQLRPGQAAPLLSVTRATLRNFITNHFPVARNVAVAAAEAAAAAAAAGEPPPPAPDPDANRFPELVATRDSLLALVDSLDLPPHFLDGALLPPLPFQPYVAERPGVMPPAYSLFAARA